jgi:hypothetical protein
MKGTPTNLIFQLQLDQSSVLGHARRDLRDNPYHQTTLVLSSFIKSLLLIGLLNLTAVSWSKPMRKAWEISQVQSEGEI